nr:cation/H(+) antiporter 15-like isoform X1 [Arachis hypogaea]XP_025698140.1 cation/H(+) antiporter 15-like isoform X1 [Arachis hypogaea]
MLSSSSHASRHGTQTVAQEEYANNGNATGDLNSDDRGVILGLLMNTKGFIEIIVLNIGWEQKVLGDEVFSIMVLVTILMTTIISHTVAMIHKPRKRHISYKNRTMQNIGTDILCIVYNLFIIIF